MCEIEKTPFVSIVCNTYNHVNFIRQCLDGFIMQQTSFPFEILVHDDASTDGTAEIVREYERNYPDLIKPIYQKENQYSKGVKVSFVYQYSRVKGKYIALCEGDDYWTDPLKLQKQVDYLEDNPDYVLCAHYYRQFFQESQAFGDILPLKLNGGISFTLEDYISYRHWYTQPLTTVFRSDMMNGIISKNYEYFKDASLFFAILSFGKGYLYPETMGIYRIQSGGVWSSASRQERIAADLNTMRGLYDAEKNIMSAMYIYNFMYRTGYLGISFFRKYMKLYIAVISILFKETGLKAINILYRSLNVFAR